MYELYYNDAGHTQIASPTLGPESIYAGELEYSHRFSPTVSAVSSVYGNYVHDLIAVGGSGNREDPLLYYNSTAPLVTFGGELELRRDWRRGWMVAASYGLSHARYLGDKSPEALWNLRSDPQRRNVANAPTHLASVKGAVPIIGHGLTAATRLSLEGPRWDRFEDVGDAPQEQTDAAVVWDIVLSGRELRWGLSYALGVYNAFDWRYSLPVSDELRQRTIDQAGRTLLASAELAF